MKTEEDARKLIKNAQASNLAIEIGKKIFIKESQKLILKEKTGIWPKQKIEEFKTVAEQILKKTIKNPEDLIKEINRILLK